MNFHATIIDLIFYILNQGEEYFKNLNKGNAFDKIVRNYHQFNEKGEKISGNKRSLSYYKFSEAAWSSPKSEWYYEHLVPIKIIKNSLLSLIVEDEVTKSNIEKVLHQTQYVVITKTEAKELDTVYKYTLPESGQNRLQAMGIQLASETKDNTLFLI